MALYFFPDQREAKELQHVRVSQSAPPPSPPTPVYLQAFSSRGLMVHSPGPSLHNGPQSLQNQRQFSPSVYFPSFCLFSFPAPFLHFGGVDFTGAGVCDDLLPPGSGDGVSEFLCSGGAGGAACVSSLKAKLCSHAFAVAAGNGL